MKRLGLVLVLVGLAGCAGVAAIKPLTLAAAVDPAALPVWNAVVDNKTGSVLCPKCQQPRISPRYARDLRGHECLAWSCANCGATWLSQVATPTLPTVAP